MSFFSRLKAGLTRTTATVAEGLKAAVGLSAKLDDATRDALEETLLQADVGHAAAQSLLAQLKKAKLPEPLTLQAIQTTLASLIAAQLEPLNHPLTFTAKPTVILVAGVNGSGKTTTIGKLAAQWAGQGQYVVVAAADTFRAAAVEQLKVWTDRADDVSKKKGKVTIIPPAKPGADPAGVAYAALEYAQQNAANIVLIDTAGRLPNRQDLLDELSKILRVIKKLDAAAPHATVLVLDATLGQNTLQQVAQFHAAAPVTGLILTKLDGTAKAGFLLALAGQKPALPVHAIGVGESLEDLMPFNPVAFSRALLGLAETE